MLQNTKTQHLCGCGVGKVSFEHAGCPHTESNFILLKQAMSSCIKGVCPLDGINDYPASLLLHRITTDKEKIIELIEMHKHFFNEQMIVN